jgi:2-keto-myo-inositol isomerase
LFPFKLSLNTSTLIPFQLGVEGQVQIAAEAGYEGIELWVKDVEAYVANGGTLPQLKRYIANTGVRVVNAIAFWTWMDADEMARKQGLAQAAKEMEMLADLDCIAAAAPPFGKVGTVTLNEAAIAFANLAELARGIGIEPYLEFWGRAEQLNQARDALYVAEISGVRDAKILLDPFHMYTGGSKLEDLAGIAGNRIGIVHVNDYPAAPSRDLITDSDRVYPGEGIAQTSAFARQLHSSGYSGYLSLELFRPDYGGKTALEVANEGFLKTVQAYSV